MTTTQPPKMFVRPLAQPLPHPDDDWGKDALCREVGTEDFFQPDGERGPQAAARNERAKRTCAMCPVRLECLETYLWEPHGVYGGMTPTARQAERKRRAAAQREQQEGAA